MASKRPVLNLLSTQTVRTSRSAPHAARSTATVARFQIPKVTNEPNKHYAPGSAEREALSAAVRALKGRAPVEVPLGVGGKEVTTKNILTQSNPSSHADAVARYSNASPQDTSAAIKAALDAKAAWEAMPFADRAGIFLKAADLISGKYRYDVMAATMVGQGKNAWQAEIDSAAELCDFLRYGVKYAEELYSMQPVDNAAGVWNRVEYRALEGFVYAVTPFNFTAIGGNLPAAPALLGNVVVWKPSPSAISSNWLVYNILREAGLPPNVIQFLPGDAEQITKVVLDHPKFSALHYTGSTAVFRSLYGKIGTGVADGKYESYPRIVGETGGKNFHLVHSSAGISHAAINTVRAAFEYQGQKCSACSRAYIASSVWDSFKKQLVQETQQLKIGEPGDFANFVGPVIHKASFDKLKTVIDEAKNDKDLQLLVGGTYDDSKGYFIHPTIYQTTKPDHPLMSRELFGPVLVCYVYDDTKNPTEALSTICRKIDSTTTYALTGAVFARDKQTVRFVEEALRPSAGNFYINTKCTGAVVGQQPFGGGGMSGTNDKAGSVMSMSRFVSMRAIKEQFPEDTAVEYPSNQV